MKQTLPIVAALLLVPVAALYAADVAHARLDEKQRAFFKDYCIECHNAKED